MNAFRTRPRTRSGRRWSPRPCMLLRAGRVQGSPEVVARAQIAAARWRMPSWWIVSFLDG